MQIRSLAYIDAVKSDPRAKAVLYYEHIMREMEYQNPSDFMLRFQLASDKLLLNQPDQSKKVLNGKLFEFAISECLSQEGVPHICQFQIGREFLDIWVPNKPLPAALTCKTTIRDDRFKAAMDEGTRVKAAEPDALIFLLTYERNHQQWSYKTKNVIDRIVCVSGTYFTALVYNLKMPVINGHGGTPPKLPAVTGQQRIEIK